MSEKEMKTPQFRSGNPPPPGVMYRRALATQRAQTLMEKRFLADRSSAKDCALTLAASVVSEALPLLSELPGMQPQEQTPLTPQ